jgi:adenylylsulfate kinase
MANDENIVWHEYSISNADRENKNNHKSAVLWFTGLSGSGKSTIANAVSKIIFDLNIQTYCLDGDNVRHGLNQDLSFSSEDRKENIRRISEVAKLFSDAGLIISTAFISPFIKDREYARSIIGEAFIEVFIDTPLEVCKKRDPKGLYKKALNGEIKNFTGLDSPYEAPKTPEIHIKTEQQSIEESCIQIINYLKAEHFIHVK